MVLLLDTDAVSFIKFCWNYSLNKNKTTEKALWKLDYYYVKGD